ncbi:MAG TPA: OB-fold domain-containing protein [Frankiaceae bacterium]|jgi:hypothetical protein|nr:OB-fold domain-containing protein [Frankiaceae bacterium]
MPVGTVGAVGDFARSDETAEFLDAAARGEFLVRRCERGHVSEPAAVCCTTCGSADVSWIAASGRARLISWAVTHGVTPSGEATANVLAIGELEEGPWWWSCIPGADPAELTVDAPLQISFERPGNTEESLPVFRLVR